MAHPCGCTPSSCCEVAAGLIPKAQTVYARWVADKTERNWKEHEKMQDEYKRHFENLRTVERG